MGSESNKMNDGTSFQLSEPALCANGCGFFGTAATMNLCSKCFRDLRIKEEQAASARVAMEKFVVQPINQAAAVVTSTESSSSSPIETGATVTSVPADQAVANRCHSCRKRVGVVGFKCRCGSSFCGSHRYPEQHNCDFDFKSAGRENISKANPVVKADKIDKRI